MLHVLTLLSALTVGQALNITTDGLTVYKNAVVNQNLTVSGTLTAPSCIANTNNLTLNQNFTVVGNSNFEGHVVANQNLKVVGNANIVGNANVNGTLAVQGATLLVGNANLVGNETINGNTTTIGNSNVTGVAATMLYVGNANNAAMTIQTLRTSHTTNGGASTETQVALPIGLILGVTARVTTTITGCTTFDIGDGTTADKWASGIAVASGTTVGSAQAKTAVAASSYSTGNIVLTAHGGGGVFSTGVVETVVYYVSFGAPTN